MSAMFSSQSQAPLLAPSPMSLVIQSRLLSNLYKLSLSPSSNQLWSPQLNLLQIKQITSSKRAKSTDPLQLMELSKSADFKTSETSLTSMEFTSTRVVSETSTEEEEKSQSEESQLMEFSTLEWGSRTLLSLSHPFTAEASTKRDSSKSLPKAK